MYNYESPRDKAAKGYIIIGAVIAVGMFIAWGISELFNLNWFVK